MELHQDIILQFEEGVHMYTHKVCISSGSRPATDISYYDEAFVPNSDWTYLPSDLISMLNATDHFLEPHRAIRIIRIPEAITTPLRQLDLHTVTLESEMPRIYQHPRYHHCVSTLKEYIALYANNASSESITPQRITYNPAKKSTVSYNLIGQTKKYVGLHVDSWDKKKLPFLHTARKRICINLGLEPRHFCFVNLSCSTMYKLLTKNNIHLNALENLAGAQVGLAFMRHFPSYPVLRIQIEPDEAYIAPTENILHDGSTESMHKPDIQLTFLGHFL